ncbi:hypothetical protein CRI69_20415 [Escherichia sp. E4742]|nr:hypothetical protein CRI69_20415 [Escherichia sp. E4742]
MLRLRSLTPVTYLCKLLGIHSLVALLGLRPRPFRANASVVQNAPAVLSCNSNYLEYKMACEYHCPVTMVSSTITTT